MLRHLRSRSSPRPTVTEGHPSSENDVPTELEIDETIVVPHRADPPPRAPFPLLGALAPLGVAVVVWFVLHSPLALVFALLSPVMALANLVDGRLSGRRARRRDDANLVIRRQEFMRRVDAFHSREVDALRRLAPSAASILVRSADAFTVTRVDAARVNLGSGVMRSTIRIDGGSTDDDETNRRLRVAALALGDAPVLAPSPPRVAVVGSGPLGHAIARGYAVQLAASLSPGAVRFSRDAAGGRSAPGEWAWVDRLPHSGASRVQLGPVDRVRPSRADAFIVVTETLEEVPPEASVVVSADSAFDVTLLRHPDVRIPFPATADFVSIVQAEALCSRLTAQAHAMGRDAGALPDSVSASQLHALMDASDTDRDEPAPRGLVATIGVGQAGQPVTVDLVANGPHAVVGGTTGSGKSELLVTWVSELARSYPATEFTVLLVDFKGGAAFDPLTGLEHCVGLITDLDPHGAERALSSLRAEIRWRERTLRESGARDISDPRLSGRLARLVIVVDEFAAMLREFPQLHDVFADVAARGRSLGLHLILCTQRPSGVVRDSLLANCELRLSLRVNNAADSTAIIGSPIASTLLPANRGRCYVSFGGSPAVVAQVAYTEPSLIVGRSSRPTITVRTPWLPPLPPVLRLEDLPRPSAGIVLGLLDLPDEQRQPPAVFSPREHGPLLVLGSAGSGKSTLLASMEQQQEQQQPQTVIRVPSSVEGAWDTVRGVARLCRDRRSAQSTLAPILVLFDDIDSVLRGFEADYQAEFVADLSTILRDGPSRNVVLVATAQRLASPLSSVAPLFPHRILFRFASRQEYLAAEGAAVQYDPRLPPGGGHWKGDRLQVAIARPAEEPATDGTHGADDSGDRSELPRALLVVSARPAAYLEGGSSRVPEGTRLLDAGDRASLAGFAPAAGEAVWIVGAPDAWLAAWTAFSSLRSTIPVLFDSCSLTEFRALTRRRELPPPIEPCTDAALLLTPEGTVERIRPFRRLRPS